MAETHRPKFWARRPLRGPIRFRHSPWGRIKPRPQSERHHRRSDAKTHNCAKDVRTRVVCNGGARPLTDGHGGCHNDSFIAGITWFAPNGRSPPAGFRFVYPVRFVEDVMIVFPCPECGKELKIVDELAGKRGRCP